MTGDGNQTKHFSAETLDKTKEIAVQFVKAYHTYSVDQPTKYLEDAKAYMTDELYEEMKQQGRREVLKRSYLTVRDTQVTPETNCQGLFHQKSSVTVKNFRYRASYLNISIR